MEYFLGSLITLISVYVISKMIDIQKTKNRIIKATPQFTQSRQHLLVMPWIAMTNVIVSPLPKEIKTQATDYFDKIHHRIVLNDESAYWISEAGLVVADIVDGEIVKESQRKVDIMNADEVQLNKIEIIVKALNDGKEDEPGNSGNKKL